LEESIRAMQEQAEAGTQAATQANDAKTAERRKAEAKLQQLLEETKVLEANNQDSYQVPLPVRTELERARHEMRERELVSRYRSARIPRRRSHFIYGLSKR